MHAFSHLLFHSRIKINYWKLSGLNPLDSALINTEASIFSLECIEFLDLNSHSHLMDCYAKYTALRRQISIRWAQWPHL